MRSLSIILIATLVFSAPLYAAEHPPRGVTRSIQDSIAVTDLVTAFTKAQHDFDQAQLSALTAESYVEISPLGELDPRDKMIGFYGPANRTAAPAMTMTDTSVRLVRRDGAVMVAIISYQVPGEAGPRTISMRAAFVAQRFGAAWKLVSAQYTPIRPKG